MAKKPKTINPNPEFDWFLREWMTTLEIQYPHAWLQKELGYSDGKASNLLTGKKRYDRDILNDVSRALKIMPNELLMHPADAMALRRQRELAAEIVNAPPRPSEHAPTKKAG